MPSSSVRIGATPRALARAVSRARSMSSSRMVETPMITSLSGPSTFASVRRPFRRHHVAVDAVGDLAREREHLRAARGHDHRVRDVGHLAHALEAPACFARYSAHVVERMTVLLADARACTCVPDAHAEHEAIGKRLCHHRCGESGDLWGAGPDVRDRRAERQSLGGGEQQARGGRTHPCRRRLSLFHAMRYPAASSCATESSCTSAETGPSRIGPGRNTPTGPIARRAAFTSVVPIDSPGVSGRSGASDEMSTVSSRATSRSCGGAPHRATTRRALELDGLRCGHRELCAALVLHADDAPRARGEVDPRIEALAAVAARRRPWHRPILHVGPAPEAVPRDLGDADGVVARRVVVRDLIGDELVHRTRRQHPRAVRHSVMEDHGEELPVVVDGDRWRRTPGSVRTARRSTSCPPWPADR